VLPASWADNDADAAGQTTPEQLRVQLKQIAAAPQQMTMVYSLGSIVNSRWSISMGQGLKKKGMAMEKWKNGKSKAQQQWKN